MWFSIAIVLSTLICIYGISFGAAYALFSIFMDTETINIRQQYTRNKIEEIERRNGWK